MSACSQQSQFRVRPAVRQNTDLDILFHRVREACDASRRDVPIGDRRYRLRKLQAMIDNPATVTNPAVFLRALDQARKERGEPLNNRNDRNDRNDRKGEGAEPLSPALEASIEKIYGENREHRTENRE